MIDPEIKSKWLAALRSGKYTQTTGKLHDPVSGGYCCIGVLCMVTDPSQISEDGFGQYDKNKKTIYDRLAEWTGIDAGNIYRLNDSLRLNFLEIADWLEPRI